LIVNCPIDVIVLPIQRIQKGDDECYAHPRYIATGIELRVSDTSNMVKLDLD